MDTPVAHIHSEIIDRCRQGDSSACQQLYKLYARSMYNTGYRIVNDADEAKDVLQEAFISAFRNLHLYRGDAAFGSWLKRIVINKALNLLKKRKAERLTDHEEFDLAAEEDNVEGEFPFTVGQVREAIERLPDGYRAVLSLYLVEGYDHSEIAEILGITESTSKSQFNRSKKKLKEILEEAYEKS